MIMEEIRIQIEGNLPYGIVFEAIDNLLSNYIGEEDRFSSFTFYPPSLDYGFHIIYTNRPAKLFKVCKIQ